MRDEVHCARFDWRQDFERQKLLDQLQALPPRPQEPNSCLPPLMSLYTGDQMTENREEIRSGHSTYPAATVRTVYHHAAKPQPTPPQVYTPRRSHRMHAMQS